MADRLINKMHTLLNKQSHIVGMCTSVTANYILWQFALRGQMETWCIKYSVPLQIYHFSHIGLFLWGNWIWCGIRCRGRAGSPLPGGC